MQEVIVEKFGGPEMLKVRDVQTPDPGEGEVRVAITSIGMNHAEIMMREGKYKIASGDPPFVPGLEAGGIIDAIGKGVSGLKVGQRVLLGVDAPRNSSSVTPGGTYRSHYVCKAAQAVPAPDAIPDDQLGAIWLP
jgi:NADPH:quinone reductase-like Zn-dependent oxidoreductase